MVLQDMIDRLMETGSCYEMEINVEKSRVVRISRHPYPVVRQWSRAAWELRYKTRY
jgi:hypothetical protein